MPTVAFVSSKGGVGKTTAALMLAFGLVERGKAVALIDSDPNLPLTAWSALAGAPMGLTLFQASTFSDLPAQLRSAKRAADWVIVDTEGGAPRMGGIAIAYADLVITPLSASALEVREALKVSELVKDISKREDRTIPLVCLFARTPGGVRRSFNQVSAQLEASGLSVLSTSLTDKEAFRAPFASGGTLRTLNSRAVSGLAAAQSIIETYTAEVMGLAEAG